MKGGGGCGGKCINGGLSGESRETSSSYLDV
jgi:hypothetical protein